MNRKSNRARRPSLTGLKWMLTTLAVAVTIGLWQVFAGQPAPGDQFKPGVALIQPAGDSIQSRQNSSSTGAPFRIVLGGSAAPAPLVVTRSS